MSPILALDDVIPHMAGLTNRAKSYAAMTAVRNALARLDGQTP